MRPVRTVAPQITALCQAAAVVIGAAVAHLTPHLPPGPKPEPESESKLKPEPEPGGAVAHVAELHMRESYKEKKLLLKHSTQTQQLEERNNNDSCTKKALLEGFEAA